MTFQKMQWLFPVAVCLHSAEEARQMPIWESAHRSQLSFHPGATKIWLGLAVLTLAAFVITYLSVRSGKQSVWAYLLVGYAAAMLANVLVPHIPASLVFGGYTPGVVTAVLINLPVMSALLLSAVREQWVSGARAVLYALVVPLSIGAAIVALLWV